MIKGTTKSGFKFEIPRNIANDYEFVELLTELDDNPLTLTKVVNRVLGKEQANKLKDHIRTDKGLVPTDLMMQEITEIFETEEEVKNS